mmetsp:Transcript_17321/g.29640  ORF Transcript_17321/g.29640 Transcript_17321/m.29640 type:complete len:116 (-) Transcript_17321:30-377(-)
MAARCDCNLWTLPQLFWNCNWSTECVYSRYYVGAKLEEGGWDPCWERRLATVIKAPKGKAFERKRPDRVKKIEANMKDMNKRIEEMRANRVKGKPKTWLEKFLRKEGLWDEKFKG